MPKSADHFWLANGTVLHPRTSGGAARSARTGGLSFGTWSTPRRLSDHLTALQEGSYAGSHYNC